MKAIVYPLSGLTALAIGLAATSVSAQTAAASPQGEELNDIVVTAQKREQSIQRIGASVSALGADAIAAIGRQDITAITTQLPSVQVNQYNPTLTVFNIRGVSQNDFSDSQEAPIAFYNDEVYVASLGAISGQNFDLARVEVLRGPQGTLFGRNATGGLIQIVTAKPTSDFEAFGTLTIGSFGQVATEAAISGPITEGVRARLSVTSNHNDGYIENRIGPDLGFQNFFGARVQLAVDIGSTGELLLKGQYLHNRDSGTGYSYIGAVQGEYGLGRPIGRDELVTFTNFASGEDYTTCPGCSAYGYREPDEDPFTGSYNTPGYFRRSFYSGTARYTQDFGSVTFTSITDYQQMDKYYGEDTDATPIDIFRYNTGQNLKQFSQELRLNGDKGDFHWVVGGYYFWLDTDNSYAYRANFIEPIGFDALDYFTRTKTQSEAIFGQIEYPLNDKFSIIGGARYSWEQKRLNYSIVSPVIPFSLALSPETDPELTKQNFGNYSGKIELDFKPSDDALIYASINRGIKGGGFATLGSVPPALERIKYGQEVLTSYEIGYKLSLLDRRMRFNGAFFYYDYDDYQAYSVVGTTQFITNNQAHSKGVELELSGTALPGLNYQLFGSWLDAKVKGISTPSGDTLTRRMPQAPEWSAGGMLRYQWSMFGGQMSAQTDWKWNDTQYFSVFNAPIDRQGAYAIGNVRVEYKPEGLPLEFAAFVNNVTDKEYAVYNLDQSAYPLGYGGRVMGRPRQFGLSVTARIQ